MWKMVIISSWYRRQHLYHDDVIIMMVPSSWWYHHELYPYDESWWAGWSVLVRMGKILVFASGADRHVGESSPKLFDRCRVGRGVAGRGGATVFRWFRRFFYTRPDEFGRSAAETALHVRRCTNFGMLQANLTLMGVICTICISFYVSLC